MHYKHRGIELCEFNKYLHLNKTKRVKKSKRFTLTEHRSDLRIDNFMNSMKLVIPFHISRKCILPNMIGAVPANIRKWPFSLNKITSFMEFIIYIFLVWISETKKEMLLTCIEFHLTPIMVCPVHRSVNAIHKWSKLIQMIYGLM